MKHLHYTGFIILALCSSCTKVVPTVSYNDYSKMGKCWVDESGKFSAFLALRDTRSSFDDKEGKYLPYFISYKCNLKSTVYENPDMGFLDGITAITILDDNGLLQKKGFLDKPLTSNAISHAGFPKDESDIYYFSGKLKSKMRNGLTVHEITTVYQVEKTRLTFEEFVDIPSKERTKIARNIESNIQ